MAEGWSNAIIAHRLWVTVGTVEERVRSMMTNLNRPEPGDDHRRVLADRLPGGALPGLVTAMTLAPARAECRWGSGVEALAVLLTAVVSAADAISASRPGAPRGAAYARRYRPKKSKMSFHPSRAASTR